MNVIRESDGEISISMLDLFIHWKVRRCNQKGCSEKPTTIISATMRQDIPIFGLCEDHFQLGNKPDTKHNYELVFDSFDAFKAKGE